MFGSLRLSRDWRFEPFNVLQLGVNNASVKSELGPGSISRSIHLLSARDRNVMVTASILQIVLALLDVVGVALLGVLVSLSVSESKASRPTYVQNIVNLSGLDSQSYQSQVLSFGVLAIVFLLGKTVCSLLLIRKVNLFLSRRGAVISQSLISKLMSGSVLALQDRSLQESLFALTTGVKKITIGVLSRIIAFNSDAFTCVVIIIGLFYVDTRIALLSVLIFGTVSFSLYILMRKRITTLGSLEAKLTIESNQEIYEVLSSFREAFVKNRRDYYARAIGAKRLKLANVDASYTFMSLSNKYALDSAILVGAVVVATIQFISVGGVEAISSLGLFLAASSRIAPAILRLQQNAMEIRNNLASSALTFRLIDAFQYVGDVPSALDEFDENYVGFEGSISVHDVSFQYPSSTNFALKNINLEFHHSKYYAIVGSSGSGKSTLVDLILGVLLPASGEVEISGKSPREAIQEWQGAIAYVPQDIVITEGTIRDNVGLGFPKIMATDERVLKAIETAQLLEFVESLPNGIDSYVGDRGTKLSGGQRQRLGIARAFFTNPKLLLLDEATSSLDAQVEAEFTAAINKLKGRVTVVVVAHRLSTVRDADSIIFLEQGTIQAIGNFDEVRRQVKNFDIQAGLMGL